MNTVDIDALQQKVNIVDIISRYLSVIRKGRNFTAICPFHDDKNPSLHISVDKQIYKCFVCSAGGNVFTFVKNYEKIGFMEAVYKVAELSNIPLEGKAIRSTSGYEEESIRLINVNESAYKYFLYNLKSADAQSTISKYLLEREIDEKIIDEFKLGYAPENNNLIRYLLQQGHKQLDIIKSGIAYERDGELLSRFTNRLMFAIVNNQKIVGFSGRRIGDSDEAKYVNSPESKIFQKNEILYNYDNAKIFSMKTRKVYVVEGFADAIAFSKAGYAAVVATMGTAFTAQHLRKLKALSSQIVLAFDSDDAGQLATLTGLEKGEKMLTMSAIDYLNKLDPDEILRQEGLEVFKKTIARELAPMEFYLKFYQVKLEETSSEVKRYQILDTLIKKVASIEGAASIGYVNKVAKISKYPIEDIASLVNKAKVQSANHDNTPLPILKKEKIKRSEKLARILLLYLINSKEAQDYHRYNKIPFQEETLRYIADYIINIELIPTPISTLITEMQYNGDEQLVEVLTTITSEDAPEAEFSKKLVEKYLSTSRIEVMKEKKSLEEDIDINNFGDKFKEKAYNKMEKMKTYFINDKIKENKE